MFEVKKMTLELSEANLDFEPTPYTNVHENKALRESPLEIISPLKYSNGYVVEVANVSPLHTFFLGGGWELGAAYLNLQTKKADLSLSHVEAEMDPNFDLESLLEPGIEVNPLSHGLVKICPHHF
jgi:hypothetical protein